MTVIIIASLITAFLAGMAALFAPCCISVMLPTYLASVFKEKYKVLLLTFIYYLGVLSVFLPIGLGFSALSEFFKSYHTQVFIIGGSFLLVMGIFILAQIRFPMPFSVHPQMKNKKWYSIFVLGLFSGIATTCCAPVLAGVMALAILPGSVFWGVMYSIIFTLGLVAPLFLIAAFIETKKIKEKMMILRNRKSLSLFGRKVSLSIAEIISGLMFVVMGIIILYYSATNKLSSHSDLQITVNIYFSNLQQKIVSFLTFIPDYLLLSFGAVLIVLMTFGLLRLIKLSQKDD